MAHGPANARATPLFEDNRMSPPNEKPASWREAVRFRALLQLLLWLLLGAAFFYVASLATVQFLSPAKARYAPPDFPWWIEFLRGVGAACIALGLGLAITYLFGNVIAEYIREFLGVALVDRRFLAQLSEGTRTQITRKTLEIVAPWCAEPLSAFMADAPRQESHQTKRRPRHEWELTNYGENLVCGSDATTSVTLSADDYFCIQIHEEALVDATFLRGDLTACFFLESVPGSEEALRKAFLQPPSVTRIIYRDLLFLKAADAAAVHVSFSREQLRGASVIEHPASKLIKIKFRLPYAISEHQAESGLTDEVVEWLPDEVRYEDGLHFYWHQSRTPPAIQSLACGSQVRLQIIHEFPISKDAGFYPIVFGSFSCNPEVIIRFATKDDLALKDVFQYLVAADPKVFHLDRNFGGRELRLHSDEHLHGREAWLFPGSGLAVRWRVR
jgi:hypothetical protein